MTNDMLAEQIIEHEREILNTPNDATMHHKLAILYLQLQDLSKAQKYLENALAFSPENAAIMNDLGVILDMQGKTNEAMRILNNAIHVAPEYPDPYSNLGKIYTTAGELVKAEAIFMQALLLNPKHVKTLNNIAAIFIQTGRPTKALEFVETALQIDPDDLMVLANYAKLLKHFYEFDKAESVFTKVLAKDPNNPDNIAEFANLKNAQGQPKIAMDLIAQALKLDPDNYFANYYYGTMLLNNKIPKKAEFHFSKALAVKNDSLSLLGFIGSCQLSLAQYEDFEKTKQQALELVQSASHYEPINPFGGQILFDDNVILHKISEQWGEHFKSRTRATPFPRINYKHKKLRIGYISGDFSNHPVGLLVEDMFKLHDRDLFEVYGFPTKKYLCNRYKHICSQFDTLELLDSHTPLEAAQIIHQHEIDILIDLVGPTANDNYDILALQPATVQCYMLGHIGTLGADYVQYYLTTKTTVPAELLATFSEKIVYLPYTEISHAAFQMPTKPLLKSDYNLPDDKFIFLAHHSFYRINQEILISWMQILTAVPNSILWFWCENPNTKDNILQFAAKHGIQASRFVFYTNSMLTDTWQHALADLFLDTFSHTSGTRTLLCAWAGVPILTALGTTPQSRAAASFCKAANVPEQIVYSKTEYIERAIELAQNPNKLKAIKEKLLTNRHTSKLFDQTTYIKHLETAFNLIWQDFCQGDMSKQIVVPE